MHDVAALIPTPSQNALVIVGAHHFARDSNDPLHAHVKHMNWGSVLLVEASPPVAEELRAQVLSANPFSSVPALSVAVINAGVCAAGGGERLPFYSFRPRRSDAFPMWATQINSFNRSHLEKHLPELRQLAGFGDKELHASIVVHDVACYSLDAQLRRLPWMQSVGLLLLDTEGLDCEVVASHDWCHGPVQPRILIFESRHCSPASLAAAKARLATPCAVQRRVGAPPSASPRLEGYVPLPSFVDWENLAFKRERLGARRSHELLGVFAVWSSGNGHRALASRFARIANSSSREQMPVRLHHLDGLPAGGAADSEVLLAGQTSEGSFRSAEWYMALELKARHWSTLAAQHAGELMLCSDVDVTLFPGYEKGLYAACRHLDLCFQREGGESPWFDSAPYNTGRALRPPDARRARRACAPSRPRPLPLTIRLPEPEPSRSSTHLLSPSPVSSAAATPSESCSRVARVQSSSCAARQRPATSGGQWLTR